MRKAILTFLGNCLIMTTMAQFTIRLEIKTLPDHHPSGSVLYVAGSFNDWNPQDSIERFHKDAAGTYFMELTLPAGDYMYKVTRGGWDRVECKKDGTEIDNRSLRVTKNDTVQIDIEEWVDRIPATPKLSTASKNVQIIDTAFFIPQLKRTRRVWIYLPEDYTSNNMRYPVMYMQDGQNVFDNATAFAGEWNVDGWLDTTATHPFIVVAIDNGGLNRLTEYNPYDHKKFGKGEGGLYADFLAKTLKPFIDKHYRTRKDKEHTFVAGSSMGGLISFYCLLKYPGVFGGGGIFSPSFPIAPGIYRDIVKMGAGVHGKIYFYCGEKEGPAMTEGMIKAIDEMKVHSKSIVKSHIALEGRHDEASWRSEFPVMAAWLMR